MRRRSIEMITMVVGVVSVLAGGLFVNYFFTKFSLTNRMNDWRTAIEEERREAGFDPMDWGLLKKTKGTMRGGATYAEELKDWDGEVVNIIGFMVALDQFRNVTEFMLLPLPIECYFCQRPPAREVLFVRMAAGEATNLFQEPVLLTGRFVLNPGEGVKYFYRLDDTYLGAGKKGGELTQKIVGPEHMAPSHTWDTENLVEGIDLSGSASDAPAADAPVTDAPAADAPPAADTPPAE